MMEQTAGHPGENGDETSPDLEEGGGEAVPAKPGGTEQNARDASEKSKHSDSENNLESSQDKNPVPPDATRHH
jgi:hypothetical protein